MPIVPVSTRTNPDLATFTILSEGQELPASVGVAMLAVTYAINKVPAAKLVLFDGDVATGQFNLSDGDLFVPGKKIEIKAGYNNDEEQIFEGIIIKHGLDISKDSSKLVLELRDPVIRMTVGRKNNYFFDSSDSEIIETLISSYPDLSANVESTQPNHAEMVQYYCSDWDFMLTRAESSGKIVRVAAGEVEVFKPDTGNEPVLELEFGMNVISFEAEMDARRQYSSSKAVSWDAAIQEIKEKEATDPGLDLLGNISPDELAAVIGLSENKLQHGGPKKDEELQSWADTHLLRSRLSKIQGRLKTLGDNRIRPGDMVSLIGFGDRFNGKAFVSSVYHEISPNQKWFTHIGLGLDPKLIAYTYDDIEDVPAAGLLPAIKGLQIGKVTALENDPDGEFRVKVVIPLINPEEEGIWARMAQMDAGDGRGSFFYPEIGDEVIIGFINEDPRDAVVLGRLYSSAKAAPLEPSDDNHEKGIFTRSGMRLVFNDDLVALTIETPNGNKILLSEDEGVIKIEDENKNLFQMGSEGIDLESENNITIKANGDIKMEGTNIELKASAEFKADGSASASLNSSGNTEVKGSIVQIN